jgi:hypothetical protein
MAITSFFEREEEWKLKFVPSAACLANKLQVDMGLCDIQTDAVGVFSRRGSGLELTFTIGTCENTVLLDGTAGVVDAVSRYGSGCSGRTEDERRKIYICEGTFD